MSHDPSEIKYADLKLKKRVFTVNFKAFLLNKNINFTHIQIYFIRSVKLRHFEILVVYTTVLNSTMYSFVLQLVL